MVAESTVPQLVDKKGGAIKPESQWTQDERRMVVQDQRLKSIIMSCLPDDIMELVISCETVKATWTDLVHSFEGYFAKVCLSKTSKPSYKSPVTGYSSVSKGFQPKFFPKLIQSSQSSSSQADPKNPKAFQPKNKGLIVETFDWDEEEVSDDEEVTHVKVLMALVDDELSMGNNHARNGEWIDITIRKVNILLYMDEDADWQNYLKYINIDLNEQILNQKKKILGGELLTESSSKKDVNENLFIPASMGYDHEMVPKSKDWVERHNPDRKLLNFNTGRILVPEKSLTPLPPLKNLQGASPSSETHHKAHLVPGQWMLTKYDWCQELSAQICRATRSQAKRKNRTLIEAPRIMLNGSVLSKNFWTEAVRIACYTQNKSIIVKRHDRTPYEIFRERILDISYFHVFGCPMFTNTLVDEIGIDNSSRYPPDEYHHEDDQSRQYQSNSDILYYIIPHGRSLTKLAQEKHVPEVIAPNEPDIPHTEDAADLINTKGTHEQNIQDKQIIT
ncbi:retrovirus-related pol polyprotein from transposon TNT 1-94 [Tanacetum coccineum]